MDTPNLGLCFRGHVVRKLLFGSESLLVSLTVLNLILNDLMIPLNGSLAVADGIGQNLMDWMEDLRDIQEAIIDAQLDVIKSNSVNKLNEEQLKNVLVIS